MLWLAHINIVVEQNVDVICDAAPNISVWSWLAISLHYRLSMTPPLAMECILNLPYQLGFVWHYTEVSWQGACDEPLLWALNSVNWQKICQDIVE